MAEATSVVLRGPIANALLNMFLAGSVRIKGYWANYCFETGEGIC